MTSSMNSGTPPVRSLTPSTTSLLSALRAELADHLRDLSAIEGAERDHAVVRAQAPGRSELGPRRRDDEERRLSRPRSARTWIRSREVGSAQCRSSKASTAGCERAPARNHAISAASCLRRSSSGGRLAARAGGKGMSTRGATSGAYSAGVEADQPQRVLEVGEALVSGSVGAAETLASPFGDRVQRRILQQL